MTATRSDGAQRRPHVSDTWLSTAMFLVGAAWVFGNSAAGGTLLAAKIALLAPTSKEFAYSLATTSTAVASTVALIGWGAISDRTRTRFGARAPWILFGGLAGAAMLAIVSATNDVHIILIVCPVYGLLQGALPAVLLAVFPDRVPERRLGTVSAIYGTSQVLAGAAAAVIGSRFLLDPDPFILIAGTVMAVGAIAFVVIAPDHSNLDAPKQRFDRHVLLNAVTPPKNAPDFYWSFANRFLLLLGFDLVSSYLLYIVTDYIRIPTERAGDVVATAGIASMVTLTVGTALGGLVSDRLGRRKPIVFVAGVVIGCGVLIPLVWPTSTAIALFAAVSGLGMGTFISVDTALMTDVIPDGDTSGKDLGILGTASSVPGIIAPTVTTAILGLGFGYGAVLVTSTMIICLGALAVLGIRSVR